MRMPAKIFGDHGPSARDAGADLGQGAAREGHRPFRRSGKRPTDAKGTRPCRLRGRRPVRADRSRAGTPSISKDVLVGEVLICGGQSNMRGPRRKGLRPEPVVNAADANDPTLPAQLRESLAASCGSRSRQRRCSARLPQTISRRRFTEGDQGADRVLVHRLLWRKPWPDRDRRRRYHRRGSGRWSRIRIDINIGT